MNRKTFLAAIAGMFAAPFIAKSKELTVPEADLQWLNANPALLHGNSNKALKIYVDGKDVAECKPYTFTSNIKCIQRACCGTGRPSLF